MGADKQMQRCRAATCHILCTTPLPSGDNTEPLGRELNMNSRMMAVPQRPWMRAQHRTTAMFNSSVQVLLTWRKNAP